MICSLTATMFTLGNISDIFLVDAKHLGQALVSEVDVSRVHLVQHKLITVVTFLPQLSLELIVIDRHELACSFLVFLLFHGILPLLLCMLNASLARFTLLCDSVRRPMVTLSQLRRRSLWTSVSPTTHTARGLPTVDLDSAHVPLIRHFRRQELAVTALSTHRIGIVATIMIASTVRNFVLESVDFRVSHVIRLGRLGNLLDVLVSVLSQGISLLQLFEDLSVQISRSGARVSPLNRGGVLVGAILNISLVNLVGDVDRLMLIRIVLIWIHAQCILV